MSISLGFVDVRDVAAHILAMENYYIRIISKRVGLNEGFEGSRGRGFE